MITQSLQRLAEIEQPTNPFPDHPEFEVATSFFGREPGRA
jgi:hypothetical protein